MSERSYGAVAVPVTEKGVVLAIPYLNENHGKREGLAWTGVTRSAVGMQYPGGAREGNENFSEIIAREWREEVGDEIEECRFEPLPVGTAILQDGGRRGEVWFGVELFRLIVTPEEEAKMRAGGAVEIIRDGDIGLRPRDEIISQLYWAICDNMGITV